MIFPKCQRDIRIARIKQMAITHNRAAATTTSAASQGINPWQGNCSAPTAWPLLGIITGIYWIVIAVNATIAVRMWGTKIMANFV